jgi:hypothetical protein
MPAPVPAPTGLTAEARTVSTGTAPAPAVQVAAALTWALPQDRGGGLTRGAPVLYHVYRQRRTEGGWTTPQRLTAGRPVVVPAEATSGDLPGAYFADGPIAAGDYR